MRKSNIQHTKELIYYFSKDGQFFFTSRQVPIRADYYIRLLAKRKQINK